MTNLFSRWDLREDIATPCAGLSFSYLPSFNIRILMDFSNVVGGPGRNLEVILTKPVGLLWEEESVHSITRPFDGPSLPRFREGKWDGWTYPLLLAERSNWLDGVRALPHCTHLKHFAFVAMNDVVEILADPKAASAWVIP
jgi:hypothetical protein